jgi:DNA-binding MarR family transcriptional regulator
MSAELLGVDAVSDAAVANEAAAKNAENTRVAESVLRLVRSLNRFRTSISAAHGDETEWMQNHLVFQLATIGPVRASVLAESVEADPSTVSRQVAALVKAGLIERRADPDDGRASLLVLTEAGRSLHRHQLNRRDVHYGEMLREWSLDDRRDLARLVDRFTNDFESYKSVILAENSASRGSASREEQV